jgi:hypothetical protein
MNPLNRALGLLAVTALIGTTSGCSIVDRLFLLNSDGPYNHQAQHVGGCRDGECQDGGCEPGACQDGACEDGACQDGTCRDGACRKPHVGRYGGLAKHHLTADEKAALAASDYGAVQPAGPPTGAVAYPYYTTRGPRDFLAKNPPSIGP